MRNRSLALGTLLSALVVASCEWPITTGCAGVGYYALRLTVRDALGNPQALGATVTLYDGAYREEARTNDDALTLYAASERGGRRYDIQVSKPHYADTWVRGVQTRGGGCVTGHENPPVTSTVPVVLALAAGAPAVRSVHLLPPRILLDRGPNRGTATFTPLVDADPAASRAIRWQITGDTGSVTFDRATGAIQYKCLARSGYLTVSAISVADSTVVGTAALAVQGHPAAPDDPPCS